MCSETFGSQQTGVAVTAGCFSFDRVVARDCLAVVDALLGCQVCHGLECGDEFRAAIGIAAVVQCIDVDEDVACI
ncbi:hypothetical protein LF1_28970 [Rubripirellula obstinata]|uniref:Uncharacterized protein n=1 Tax=Rubripirellula obstinata TaxID=406547 RepID=A0A5B1CGN3_9BACT|nr:hypothetical protein LF1_28970 [Rubripirellula obstinata]